MNHTELMSFIETKMSMQHIYQPLLIKTLVECGGSATVRQLAQAVLSLNEPQIRYYENRIKEMPVPVLKRHGVIQKEGDLVSLATGRLTLEQRSELLMTCEKKLREFLLERGDDFWAIQYEAEPVALSIRYDALKRAGKRCELCGVADGDANYEERLPLHVDHIVPRSKGGSNDLDNLQVLCRACNLGKSDRDDTDFRGAVEPVF
jgi:ATP adenylyltransferase